MTSSTSSRSSSVVSNLHYPFTAGAVAYRSGGWNSFPAALRSGRCIRGPCHRAPGTDAGRRRCRRSDRRLMTGLRRCAGLSLWLGMAAVTFSMALPSAARRIRPGCVGLPPPPPTPSPCTSSTRLSGAPYPWLSFTGLPVIFKFVSPRRAPSPSATPSPSSAAHSVLKAIL